MNTNKKYKDIINLSRPPVPDNHPRMPLLNRAKIFSPFAALRGYEEKIDDQDERQHMLRKPEFTEDEKKELNQILLSVQKKEKLKIIHFLPVFDSMGIYQLTEGSVLSVDYISQVLRLSGTPVKYETDGLEKDRFTDIHFEDIIKISRS